MGVHKLTYALLFVVLTTLVVAAGRHQEKPSAAATEREYQKQLQVRTQRFPTAEYEEAQLLDGKQNPARKEKNRRKNDFKVVARNPPLWAAEVVVTQEGGMDFPALPIADSTLIISGRVSGAEAHISQNKKNVYSEFTVLVEKVFKSSNGSVVEGTEVRVDRTGGFVKYPNGHAVLYRISGTDMPLTGERYLFFLTSKNEPDISILTAYELTSKGVAPLDESSQFEQYRGLTESALLGNLREALAKASPH